MLQIVSNVDPTTHDLQVRKAGISPLGITDAVFGCELAMNY